MVVFYDPLAIADDLEQPGCFNRLTTVHDVKESSRMVDIVVEKPFSLMLSAIKCSDESDVIEQANQPDYGPDDCISRCWARLQMG